MRAASPRTVANTAIPVAVPILVAGALFLFVCENVFRVHLLRTCMSFPFFCYGFQRKRVYILGSVQSRSKR